MKKAYSTPRAKMINFEYDEQVVASSITGCDKLMNIGSKDFALNPNCTDIIREGMRSRSLEIIGCGIYTQSL